jgi:ATPase family AAA domain-containing protein 2
MISKKKTSNTNYIVLEYPYSQLSHANGSQSQSRVNALQNSLHRSATTADTGAKQHGQPSDIRSLLNNEEELPRLNIDHGYIDQLRIQLTQQTSGCSVEQLEQINTHLMDCLWKKRGEWDRTKVAGLLKDDFNEILQDMQNNQRFLSMSQHTKGQLATQGSNAMFPIS